MGYFQGMARYASQRKCPVARTLDMIGERWTILILRDLLLHGPRRYQDFQDSLAGVAPNTLAARLKAMEADGLVERKLRIRIRSEEHTSELQSHSDLVCRLLL